MYCISVLNDYKRRKYAIEQFLKYDINYEFVSAIDPKYVSQQTDLLSKEEISLCLMNKLCIENSKINGYSSIVIMEDDFKFNDGWLETFFDFQNHLPDDWDFLYMGQSNQWRGISDKQVVSVNNYVDRIKYGCGAHFIAIRETIYDICCNLIGELDNRVDICYWNIMKDDTNYNCYSPKVNLADSISSPDKSISQKIENFTLTDYFPSRLNIK